MVKKEIKRFELKLMNKSFSCSAPCTVKSVLSAAKESLCDLGSEVSFETVITADQLALSYKYFYLRIQGINRPAKIVLGGKTICRCDGITPVYNIDITDIVSLGENILSVCFSSDDGDILYAGLGGSFELLRFSGAIIDRVNLDQLHQDGQVNLGIKLELLGDTSPVRAVATLVSPGGQIYYAGLTRGEGSVIVRDPLYWWPRGLGVQNLYRLTVNLYGEMDVEDSYEMRIGLRTVEIGEGYALKINGSNMIPMGALYFVDEDPDQASSDKRTETQVLAAAKSGYNCLALPFSSAPTDKFYEL